MESSAPAKPQPLHNFDLPNLKWKTDGNSSSSHHHRRRSVKSPSGRSPTRQSPPLRESPIRVESPKPSPIRDSLTSSVDPERLSSIRVETLQSKGTPIMYRGNNSRNSASAASGSIRMCTEKAKDKIDEKPKPTEEIDATGIKRSKILIKIPRINNTKSGGEKISQDEPLKIVHNNGEHGGLTTDEINDNSVDEEMKIWNLRPRKPKRKSSDAIVDPVKTEKSQPPLKNTNKSGEKKEKKKISICISLSKEEIEEDIYSFTGLKPSRRPKKRAKNVQKKVDSLFPGLWLVSITPDSYRVSENSMKG